MQIIKDLRILKALEKRSDWRFDREFKYCTSGENNKVIYKNKTYKLKYFSGCFYPYCIEIN